MKTSNKLLLGFIGVLFAGMLTCNFILKAEYVKLKDTKVEIDEYRILSKDSFKAVNVFGGEDFNRVSFEYANDYEISSLKEISDYAKIWFRGDTLFIRLKSIPDSLREEQNAGRLIIKCPLLQSLQLKDVTSDFSDFKLDNLKVVLKGNANLNFYNIQIRNLLLEEYNLSSAEIQDYDNEDVIEKEPKTLSYINHLKLRLYDKSDFGAEDIPFKTIDPIVEDSANLSLSGASLRPLLKRNVQ